MEVDRIPAEVRADVVRRLRRAEGQVRAVARALEEGGRECEDVVHQLAAAKSALERAGVRLLSGGLKECLRDASLADEILPADFEKMFMELA